MLSGLDGAPHDYRLVSKDGATRILKTKEVGIHVMPGDMFEVHSGGGGGWGDPPLRTLGARQRDVEQGLISASPKGAA